MPEGLSIVVPVYNEGEAVMAAAERLVRVREAAGAACEVIFVDDGSDDGTENALSGLSSDGVSVVRHDSNRGYGAALKTGIRRARYDCVAITDADGTYPLERLGDLYNELVAQGADMVVGARTGANVSVPLIRRPAKWCLTKLANFLVGRKIPDLNSGLRVMRREVVERFLNILPDGFSFTTTITLAMLSNGYAVRYAPIDYSPRVGRSKVRPVYDTLNFLQLICRTTLYFNPLRVFLPLALILVAAGVVVALASGLFLGRIMDVTFGVCVMSAVIVLAIGLLADLIDKRLQ